ncbi:MAG: helix-hairpin-helix domain-containing protein [Microgenomates group bacterium]
MTNFLPSFKPVLKALNKKIKRYRLEIFLLFLALIAALISLIIFLNEKTNQPRQYLYEADFKNKNSSSAKIYVDIAGAVKKPDVYEVSMGARLKDVLILAGGLSDEADKNFFQRNFNLARVVSDQEKFYVPSVYEIQSGLFSESTQTLDYNQPNFDIGSNNIPPANSQLININTATMEELDQLPGIGKVTAQKIIQNRPYATIDELLNKKIVNKSTFEKIKDQITIE